MVIGFVGSFESLSKTQLAKIRKILRKHNPIRVYHGMSLGADSDFHLLVRKLLPECSIEGYPLNGEYVMIQDGYNEIHQPLNMTTRIKHYAFDASLILIAQPTSERALASFESELKIVENCKLKHQVIS